MTNIFIASLDCAGFLLLLLSEEQSFWVLECIVNELHPPDYYTHNLLGVHTDQRVLAHLVDEMFPDVSETLGKAGVELQVRAFIFIPYMIIFGRRGAAGESRQSVLYAPQSACMITIIAISLSAISCLRRSSPSICALKTYVCTHAVPPRRSSPSTGSCAFFARGFPRTPHSGYGTPSSSSAAALSSELRCLSFS